MPVSEPECCSLSCRCFRTGTLRSSEGRAWESRQPWPVRNAKPPALVERRKHQHGRADCSAHERRVHFVDLEARGRHHVACFTGIGDSHLCQVYIRPAREAIRSVPLRLPVPHQDETGMRLLEGCPRRALHARRRSRRCKEAHGRGGQPADAQDAQHARVPARCRPSVPSRCANLPNTAPCRTQEN